MSEIEITDASAGFTERYLASCRDSLPEDETKAVLQDRSQSGWLAWGKKMEVTRLTGWEEIAWEIDPTCAEGLGIFQEVISDPEWWQKVRELCIYCEDSKLTVRSRIIGRRRIQGHTHRPHTST